MDKRTNLRLLTDLESTRVRGMDDVAKEARAREASAMRAHRVADAAMYAEVAERAEAVAAREQELGYARRTLDAEEADRARARRGLLRAQRLGGAALVGVALFGLLLLLTGCGSMPPIRPGLGGATLEAYAGSAAPSGRGHEDVGDVGPYGVVGIGGSMPGEHAATEWWVEGGRAEGEVDAGAWTGVWDSARA
jgi:hypothetical protein